MSYLSLLTDLLLLKARELRYIFGMISSLGMIDRGEVWVSLVYWFTFLSFS